MPTCARNVRGFALQVAAPGSIFGRFPHNLSPRGGRLGPPDRDTLEEVVVRFPARIDGPEMKVRRRVLTSRPGTDSIGSHDQRRRLLTSFLPVTAREPFMSCWVLFCLTVLVLVVPTILLRASQRPA